MLLMELASKIWKIYLDEGCGNLKVAVDGGSLLQILTKKEARRFTRL